MLNQPSNAFANAFSSSLQATAVQSLRHPALASRMTNAATALITAMALAMTTAPIEAQAQSQDQNQVKRAMFDILGGAIGGALGNQVGGGRGKKAATVAGIAAGVLAAEALQDAGRSGSNGRLRDVRADNFGPYMAPGWGAAGLPDARTTQRQQYRTLQSGTELLAPDRMEKLMQLERSYLGARDVYARAMYMSQQVQDDLVLDPSSRSVQSQLAAVTAQRRAAQEAHEQQRSNFVQAVEYLGARGYDVHEFAHSHRLSATRVTGADMSRGDAARYSQGRAIQMDADIERGDAYGNR